MTKEEQELYQRTDEILFYKWDPLNMWNTPEARDEYHSYFPVVFSMLKTGDSPKKISDYLGKIERDKMGLPTSAKPNREISRSQNF